MGTVFPGACTPRRKKKSIHVHLRARATSARGSRRQVRREGAFASTSIERSTHRRQTLSSEEIESYIHSRSRCSKKKFRPQTIAASIFSLCLAVILCPSWTLCREEC